MRPPIITLLTDFGGRDGYVAAMKGVLLSLVPHAVIADAGHDIEPFDVEAAAWALSQYAGLYPAGTVHVVVVDPGVGTRRAGIVGSADGRLFVAPDNGVLHWVNRAAADAEFRRIRDDVHRPGVKSSTFHGRDVFAYVAARLAERRNALDELSEPLDALAAPPWPAVRPEDGGLRGTVLHVDRFGNLVTSIRREDLARWAPDAVTVEAGSWSLGGLHETYADVSPGQPVALIGSHGHLELAVHRGPARQVIGLDRGDEVRICPARW